jgi:hypothetical protein
MSAVREELVVILFQLKFRSPNATGKCMLYTFTIVVTIGDYQFGNFLITFLPNGSLAHMDFRTRFIVFIQLYTRSTEPKKAILCCKQNASSNKTGLHNRFLELQSKEKVIGNWLISMLRISK